MHLVQWSLSPGPSRAAHSTAMASFLLPLPAPRALLRERAGWPCFAVVKVMHWESRKSSSLAVPSLIPAIRSPAFSSHRYSGWYCSTRPYSAGSDRMKERTALSLSFSRTAAWDAVMPSLSEPSSSESHNSGLDLEESRTHNKYVSASFVIHPL